MAFGFGYNNNNQNSMSNNGFGRQQQSPQQNLQGWGNRQNTQQSPQGYSNNQRPPRQPTGFGWQANKPQSQIPAQFSQQPNTHQPYSQPQQPPLQQQQPFQQQQPHQQQPRAPQPGGPMNFASPEQLHAINKGLPDGVMYEPLGKGGMPSPALPLQNAQQPASPSVQPGVQLPSLPPTTAFNEPPGQDIITAPYQNVYERLEKFIQNERNGASYYGHLASISSNSEIRSIMHEISDNCDKRKDDFSRMYAEKLSRTFAANDAPINKLADFNEGIALAIREENRALRDLGDICGNIHDESILKFLYLQMYKKIADLSYLHLINSMK